MSLTVKISASLRDLIEDYDPQNGLLIEVNGNENVAQLLRRLGIDNALVKIIMVNGVISGTDSPLKDGDRVALFPPVGGG